MNSFDHTKYQAFKPVDLPKRQWPDKTIKQAPQWCSVDLRDGNQALIEPMTPEQKLTLFNLLVKVGFKQIEVGFPAASETDYNFVRKLIEEDLIPPDVTVQVLTQARADLIARSFEALKGVKRAIVHLYNSTSTVQREQVFKMDRAGITELAIQGARSIQQHAQQYPATQWQFQYSPESFTGTEMDFAVDICNAVLDVWQPHAQAGTVIINLPATVEMSTPNVYADQVEWFCGHVNNRESISISVHAHNDRGCAVAASELAMMAGADRIEGTLMGNGERTGNLDIVTMAMNLYSQGIDPELDFANMDEIIHTVQECTQMDVHPRHPYAGELVFTAFSGSHQDAINKGLAYHQPGEKWNVAYLPINPADLGRSYQQVIRINSQSGKGGIAHVLEREYGLQLPRWLQIDFSSVVQRHAELSEGEVCGKDIWQLFEQKYLSQHTHPSAYRLSDYHVGREQGVDSVDISITANDITSSLQAKGNGVIDAFVSGIRQHSGQDIVLLDYAEHAITRGENSSADAQAIAYIQLSIDGKRVCAAGRSNDIIEASLLAIINGINRSGFVALHKTVLKNMPVSPQAV